MSYPVAYRLNRPSRALAAVAGWGTRPAPAGTWYIPKKPLPRIPRFGWLLLAAVVLDAALNSGDQSPDQISGPMWDLTGWYLHCGPAAPAPLYETVPRHWRFDAPEPVFDFCGLTGQAISGIDDMPLPTDKQYRTFYASLSLPVYEVCETWGRTDDGPPPVQAQRPVAPAIPVISGVTDAVVPPAVAVPSAAAMPIALAPATPLPVFPEQSDRGYWPPLIGTYPVGTYPNARPIETVTTSTTSTVTFVSRPVDWPDVKPVYPDVERKYASNSAGGQFFAVWFKALSTWGSANGAVDALWRALLGHVRTNNARTMDKYRDLFSNLDQVDFSEATLNAIEFWAYYKTAGALFGGATRNLADTFGTGAGFGLYRAWATGERAYSPHGARLRSDPASSGLSAPEFRSGGGYVGRRGRERNYDRAVSRAYTDYRRSRGPQAARLAELRRRLAIAYNAKRRADRRARR